PLRQTISFDISEKGLIMKRPLGPIPGLLSVLVVISSLGLTCLDAAPARGWLSWRGPQQSGASVEKILPDKIAIQETLWTADIPGQSTPVVADGKIYIMGYLGDGPDLQEVVACFDAETGKKLWQNGFSDFLSDIIYHRY